MKINANRTVLLLAFYITCVFGTGHVYAAPGDLDPTFGNGGKVVTSITQTHDFVRRVRIQPDGKIVTFGGTLDINQGPTFVTRHNANGTLDTSFGTNGVVNIPGSNQTLNDFIILPNGDLILTGHAPNSIGELRTTAIFRLNANGAGGFASNGGIDLCPGRRILAQPDGKLVVIALCDEAGGFSTGGLFAIRYTADGRLDSSFGSALGISETIIPVFVFSKLWAEYALMDFVGDAAIQPDGKILVSAGGNAITVARLNTDGRLDTSFSGDGIVGTNYRFGGFAHPTGIALQPDGKIVLNGVDAEFGLYRSFMLRLGPDGTPDRGFGTDGMVIISEPNPESRGIASALAIQPNGKILTAGTRNGIFALARYHSNGSIDTSFGANGIQTTPVAGNPGFDTILSLASQPDGKVIAAGSVRDSSGFYDFGLVRYLGDPVVNAANIEELYAAVNNPQNAGSRIHIGPGVYMLSANAPNGGARPNGGRLELQENMSLMGAVDNRGSVVIDAMNLPASSYTTPIPSTGAIRMGRGNNSIEWLTIRNAANGGAGIIVHLSAPGTTRVRIAHVAARENARGIDVRNVDATSAAYVIDAEIVDNDLFNSTVQGLRIVNLLAANGGIITARLSGNRTHDNREGLLVVNNRSISANISVTSSGDRFYGNGAGTIILGGVTQGSALTPANGNTITFDAQGTSFEDNNGITNFDVGGLVIVGGDNPSTANGTSNNTVNVTLRGCRFGNNQLYDLAAIGARSNPSIGLPGTNNRVILRLTGTLVPIFTTADSIPTSPGGMNSVTVSRNSVVPSFDYDGDGRADVSVFRPSNGFWYINRNLSAFDAVHFGLAADKLTPADYDGDGKTDIAVYRSGIWYLRRSQLGFLGFAFGEANDIPQPADFDGDGRAEIAVWRPSNGTWYVFNLATNGFTALRLGAVGDKPVVGDYDGDGKADAAVYRPSNGTWSVQRSRDGMTEIQFGSASDKPVPADYDGDGKTDLAVFRPSEGNWYIRRSLTNTVQTVNWGLAADTPVPANYDGDGKSDIAIFRPSESTWHVFSSTSGIYSQPFGLPADIPTPGAFAF